MGTRPCRFTEADLVKLRALRQEGRTVRQIVFVLSVGRSMVQRALAQKVRPMLPGQGRRALIRCVVGNTISSPRFRGARWTGKRTVRCLRPCKCSSPGWRGTLASLLYSGRARCSSEQK